MKAIYALYATPNGAQRAVDNLRQLGLADREITILSSEPLEEYEFAQRDKQTSMTWIAAFGGLIGLTTGYLLTSLTQKAWAINTGGMPIVTNWTNLIIIFELTMLGGVFAAVLSLFITAKLPARAAPLYDPAISDGKILVGVTNPRETAGVERALLAAGVRQVKTV